MSSQVFENYCLFKLFFKRKKIEPRFLPEQKNGIWFMHVLPTKHDNVLTLVMLP